MKMYDSPSYSKSLFKDPLTIWGILVGIVVLISVLFQTVYPLLILPVLMLVYATVSDVKQIFFFLFFLIPLSKEIQLPGGFSLDVPNEPVMLGLFLIYIIWFIRNLSNIDLKVFLHPVILIFVAHYFWMLLTTLHSEYTVIAVKFFLAKTWYVTVFLFLAHYLLTEEKDFRKIFRWFFIALLFTIVIVTIRHGIEQNFSFAGVNFVMGPFYMNHVAYGSIQAVSLPFIYWMYRTEPAGSGWKWFYLIGMLIMGMGIYLSFTRAAIGAVILALGVVFIIRSGWIRYALVAVFLGVGVFIYSLVKDSKYLNLAPDFEKTITHQSFENLLDATYKLQDISTMERVHRWVAAFHMFEDRPWFGFGPGNFYENYQAYTLHQFSTYVSDNPEKSGIHNYYLMILIEQGLPGLIIFLSFLIIMMIFFEKIYFKLILPGDKLLLLCASMSFSIILILQFMNDLIETDKVGPFFYLAMVILVFLHFKVEQPSLKKS